MNETNDLNRRIRDLTWDLDDAQLWSVLTALMEPDEDNSAYTYPTPGLSHNLKYYTTSPLRYVALRLNEEMNLLSFVHFYMIDPERVELSSLKKEERIITEWRSDSRKHFVTHHVKAVDALVAEKYPGAIALQKIVMTLNGLKGEDYD